MPGACAVSASAGHYETAARLFGAAEVLCERIGLPQPRHHSRYEYAVATCREALGNEGLLALWQVGRESRLATAIADALGVGVQASTSTRQACTSSFGEVMSKYASGNNGSQ